jgi:hypothetical protein
VAIEPIEQRIRRRAEFFDEDLLDVRVGNGGMRLSRLNGSWQYSSDTISGSSPSIWPT